MLAVIVTIMTITERFICSAIMHYDNNGVVSLHSLQFFVKITGRSIYSVCSYCDNNDNNGEVYM